MARKVDDAGERVDGARKDRWRDSALGLQDLGDLSVREAEQFVTKDLVWPVPDFEALVRDGWEPKAAALLKVIRDRVAVGPDLTRKDPQTREPLPPAEARRLYVRMLGIAQDALRDARTVEGVAAACRRIPVEAGYRRDASHDPRVWNLLSQANGPQARRVGAFHMSLAETRRAEVMVRDGFPAKVPAWRKGVVAYEDGKGAWYAAKKVAGRTKVLAAGFGSEAAVFAHLEAQAKAKRAKAGGPEMPPERPDLDVLERTGLPDRRGGRSVTPQEFIETFGFRHVQFGEWVPDNERQAMLDMGFDGMWDLAETLGLEPAQMGFGGILSAAFGSRGTGGRRAHYEPTRRIYNLTRLRGAGTLAHEFGHALDDLAGQIGRGRDGGLVYATGGHDRMRTLAGTLPGLSPEAEAAWEGMMSVLWSRPRTRDEAVRAHADLAAGIREGVAKTRADVDRHVERVPEERRNRKWMDRCAEWCAEREESAGRHERVAAELAAGPAEGDFGSTPTDYMREATRLCGKSGTYYKRPCEMFARAFEAAVFDALAERGGRSDYLVHGVEGDRYADPERYVGNPYPTGDERRRFLEAFRRLAAAMAPPLAALSRHAAGPEAEAAAPGMAA